LKRHTRHSKNAGLLRVINKALFILDHDGGSLFAERVQRLKKAIKPIEIRNWRVALIILYFLRSILYFLMFILI
jgi:hypothetical protein